MEQSQYLIDTNAIISATASAKDLIFKMRNISDFKSINGLKLVDPNL